MLGNTLETKELGKHQHHPHFPKEKEPSGAYWLTSFGCQEFACLSVYDLFWLS
jgi:hypothetical protein